MCAFIINYNITYELYNNTELIVSFYGYYYNRPPTVGTRTTIIGFQIERVSRCNICT